MCSELTQRTSREGSFAVTVMSATLRYIQFYTSSVPENISADAAFPQNLSTLLKGGTISKKDQVSWGHIPEAGFEGFLPGKFLLSNLFIFSLQSEQELAAIHHVRIAMALLGMKYQQNSATDKSPELTTCKEFLSRIRTRST